METEELAHHLIKQAQETSRFLVAISGPPGSGKSTLATQIHHILKEAGERSAVVQMDGFHLDNYVLTERSLISRKGSPQSFDGSGFVHLIRRLKENAGEIAIPVFDRERDIAIAGAQMVGIDDRIVLVEGNYLLIDQQPWHALLNLWDLSVFLNPGMDILRQRLVQRWLDHGLDFKAAELRAASNDIPNAEMVVLHSSKADIQI